MHEEPLDNILLDLKEALLDQEAAIYTKSIQHQDSVVLGQLYLFYHQIDTLTWEKQFLASIQDIYPEIFIFSITSKTIYDGKKSNKSVSKKRIWAIHIETENQFTEHVTRAMKVILSSDEFKARYTINVRLIPKITTELDEITKSRIQRAILQHDQIMANLGKAIVPGLQYLDGNISKKFLFHQGNSCFN